MTARRMRKTARVASSRSIHVWTGVPRATEGETTNDWPLSPVVSFIEPPLA